ncbi:glutaredoxin [Solemya pervernicosa gill symbiont]|uniref:Glutaredoxin n=3 Tax=Gammaproteobacteria incertae sedis TaxID=118884 RepID=A0A1T2L2K6_9GAMM|nr:glutaredoxin [Solemya pervernicosa gill symbiont]QKQ28135.1 glutathione S-transferase N-terminal domain-containing protein [Candidatus Reidiella endopervernicosa]
MRLFFRYFFKLVHLIVGPMLLAWDWATTPKGIDREREQQQRIDEETQNFTLYQFRTCPFCIKVRRAIKRLSLNIDQCDAQRNGPCREALLEGGGAVKVPCLKIARADGTTEWLYESNDIIAYLQQNYA